MINKDQKIEQITRENISLKEQNQQLRQENETLKRQLADLIKKNQKEEDEIDKKLSLSSQQAKDAYQQLNDTINKVEQKRQARMELRKAKG